MLNIACNNEQKVTVTAAPTTASGKPASFDGALRVTVVSGDGTVEQDPATPLSFKAVSPDTQGETTTEYLVEADVDLGEGTTLIQETVILTVTGVQAASFGLSAGVIEEK